MSQETPPPKGSTFGINSDHAPVLLTYNGLDYKGGVSDEAVLQPGIGKVFSEYRYHLSGYVAIAQAWAATESWQNFVKFDLTNLHIQQHSFGGFPLPSDKPSSWESYTLGGLFAHANFKATTVIMDRLQFKPDYDGADASKAFFNSLTYALKQNKLSHNHSITAVSLVDASTALTSDDKEHLRKQFLEITFTF